MSTEEFLKAINTRMNMLDDKLDKKLDRFDDKMGKKLDSIDAKVNNLYFFKERFVGIMMTTASIVTFVWNIIIIIIKKAV